MYNGIPVLKSTLYLHVPTDEDDDDDDDDDDDERCFFHVCILCSRLDIPPSFCHAPPPPQACRPFLSDIVSLVRKTYVPLNTCVYMYKVIVPEGGNPLSPGRASIHPPSGS